MNGLWPYREPLSLHISKLYLHASVRDARVRHYFCICQQIAALCSVVALLAAPSLAQGSGDSALTSPCPSVFTYAPRGAEPGSWSGAATLSSDTLLTRMSLSIELDSPALGVFGRLNNWTGNATSQDNVQFMIDENDFKLDPKQSVMMDLVVQYDPVNTTPRLRTIRLNGKVICNVESLQALDNSSSAAVNTMHECGVVAGGNSRFPLIYNGHFYKKGEIPWLVVIYKLNKGVLQRICGGTLISELHVLTAAHCLQLGSWFVTPVEDVTVKIGVHSLNDDNTNLTITRKLTARYIHEEYDPFTLQNDILILTLDKSVRFTNYIRPACLWGGDTRLSRVVGATGIVAGWGRRSADDTRGKLDEPQMVRAPIVSTLECRGSKAVFHQVTYNTTLCAGYRNGSGPCSGDSGGGLYLLERGKWMLRGVVSLSLQNTRLTCDLNEYVVFTDTAQFLPWTRKIIGDKYIDDGTTGLTSNSPEGQCGKVVKFSTPLVVNGIPTMEGQWPWHVALYKTQAVDNRYICGGTLVSHKYVITAAHCVTRKLTERPVNSRTLTVHVGKHNLRTSVTGVQIKFVKEIIVNPNYNSSDFRRNVAILELYEPVTYSDWVRPACLWPDNEIDLKNVIGKTGSVVGWRINDSGVLADELALREMPVVSQETCIRSYPEFFVRYTSDHTYCAGNRNGSSVCNGDSGGGMFVKMDGVWYLRGLLSLVVALPDDKRCDPSHYAIFTDLAKFLPWIYTTVTDIDLR
ncbi:hypothetical protein PYW07_008443 [Mythimna separata]|uniref:Peptidase S1 domain-containing protein n=1 Tax=Mythimna separata TaxID=271217 RepID=A0AAD7YD62_MYTSE|nr:hypothetical protein PYW07_008443 [Mythimna separata]